MRDSAYYLKLYFDPQNILEKDILLFLNSLNKIKSIQFFFVFLDRIGLETIKKMKKIQKNNGFDFTGNPIISNEKERELIEDFQKKNEQILLIVIRHCNHNRSAIDGVINMNKKMFYKINKKITEIKNIDIVTPLNMRSDYDILKLSFLLSKYAISLLNVKRETNLKDFPSMFLGIALIFDLAKIFKKQELIKEIIRDYYFYLLDYFQFSQSEGSSINQASKKYIKIIQKIDDRKFNFQKHKLYLSVINELHQALIKNKSLIKINNKPNNKKLYGIFFHWFNNSLNVHFAQEVVLIFVLKNFYERQE